MPEVSTTRIRPYVIRVYLGSILAFFLVKGAIRPWVLARDFWVALDVIVLSFPNLVEAIVGISNVYGLILIAKHRGVFWMGKRSDRFVLFVSGALTGLFVLTQELGLHHLGGNNVTDPFDVAASIVGIVLMMTIFSRYGFFKEMQRP